VSLKRRPSVKLTGTEVGGGGKSTKSIIYGEGYSPKEKADKNVAKSHR
jgi:hypothetical protein